MVDEKVDANPQDRFVSRGGMKLQHALDGFGVEVRGLVGADFGCSVGGFTDCLLQNGAAHVHAVDTAYGVLDYKLRSDGRVTVFERTNVLYFPAEQVPEGGVDLVVIDAGWTTQLRVLPIALEWLREGGGRIVSLVKPHYEWKNMAVADAERLGVAVEERGETTVLSDEMAKRVCDLVVEMVEARLALKCLNVVASPIRGGGKRRKKKDGPGNIEYLALFVPVAES